MKFPNALNVPSVQRHPTAAMFVSLFHNFRDSDPNWMKLVSMEILRRLVSNGKCFIRFGSPVGKIWAEHSKWPELKLKRLSE